MRHTLAQAAILGLLARRAAHTTICPSEAARQMAGDRGDPDGWRGDMPAVHAAARELAGAGRVRLTQGGKPVADPVGAYRVAPPGKE